ncbi:hypothetical protein LCGC14_0221380 [marine sediment metagenome]|uniref:HD domain-containing protein n=1 Tax=marine sediment metagenome TaxID=412755 RepID=A0A0F9UDN0_9ZZZZ
MTKPSLLETILRHMRPSKIVMPSFYWRYTFLEFPELQTAKGIYQRNGQSVWEHTMNVIDRLSDKTDIALLAGLFHDLGKCKIPPMDDPSLPRFPGHPIASANIAENTLALWGGRDYLIDRVSRIVSTHMYDISNATREKTIRKFVADVGQDNIENWFDVRIADSSSYSFYSNQKQRKHRSAKESYYSRYIEPFHKVVMSYLEKQPKTDQPKFTCPVTGMQIEGGDD